MLDRGRKGNPMHLRRAFISLFTGLMLLASPVLAWTPGETVNIGAYCNISDEAFMKKFARDLASGGVPKYMEMMEDLNLPCFDARLHPGIRPIEIELLKRMYSFTMPEGRAIEVWKIKDGGGLIGFTWLKAPDNI